jgi:hypothetical protein
VQLSPPATRLSASIFFRMYLGWWRVLSDMPDTATRAMPLASPARPLAASWWHDHDGVKAHGSHPAGDRHLTDLPRSVVVAGTAKKSPRRSEMARGLCR